MIAARIGLAALAFAGAEPALADPSGVWREKDGGTIRVYRCGAGMCGSILSVQPRLDPATGKPRTDKHNENAARRNRTLVGLAVLIGMRPSGAGKWSGRLYDADRGKMFPGHLIETGPRTIRIEGCALGLCGGEELTRVK